MPEQESKKNGNGKLSAQDISLMWSQTVEEEKKVYIDKFTQAHATWKEQNTA